MTDWTLGTWIEVAAGLLWATAGVTALVCAWRLPSETRIDPKTGRRFPFDAGYYGGWLAPSWLADIYTPKGSRLRATMWWALAIMVAEIVALHLWIR